ncbi:hypothetical protein GCM10011583_18160 [Streptomyces camponoticapitis]|uniref:SpdD-like protein n=1 Tax=Streptomyces camponoticapitis TaxID=1616125 RepID=A0ABQ2E1R6_9ACTN|nr:hypothetical protein [Streptomyces camponoticapitis]GGJ86928.1 hypothetical protein GCM10011583_18160 [Streptomyces camponoticapitis]
MPLSDRRPAPTAGQPTPEPADDQAQMLIAAVNEALAEKPTAFRDDTPLPVVGTALPVPQPGRPPMSQGATDASTLMLAGGATTLMVSMSAAGLMYFSQFADPVACAIVLGAPTALVLAVSRLVAKTRTSAPPVIHQHYNGTVVQDSRSITTSTRGVIANTRNQTPR